MFCVKIFVLRNEQNLLRFMRKRCPKVRKKIFRVEITQILLNKYGHFVETLIKVSMHKCHITTNFYSTKEALQN